MSIVILCGSGAHASSPDCHLALTGTRVLTLVGSKPRELIGKLIEISDLDTKQVSHFFQQLEQLDAWIDIRLADGTIASFGQEIKWQVRNEQVWNLETKSGIPLSEVNSVTIKDLAGVLEKKKQEEVTWMRQKFPRIMDGSMSLFGKRLWLEDLSREEKARIMMTIERQGGKQFSGGRSRVYMEINTIGHSHIGAGMKPDRQVVTINGVGYYSYANEMEMRREAEEEPEEWEDDDLAVEILNEIEGEIRRVAEEGRIFTSLSGSRSVNLDDIYFIEVCNRKGNLPYDTLTGQSGSYQF